MGLAKGDRVLLVFEPSLQYLTAFIACVRVGLIAVPVFPPGACRETAMGLPCRRQDQRGRESDVPRCAPVHALWTLDGESQ